eukprot:GILJ01010188.1.p1 GENE.GILJ01010188.1~~GILJ01010188.1.p1  ORF type:complete len:1062 (+),score=129.11 GILJ01010188.1:180-3188(+)
MTFGVAVIGLIVVYLFDAFDFKEGALLASWLSLGGMTATLWAAGITLLKRSFLNIFLFVNIGFFCFLVGAAVSLQFRWLQDFDLHVVVMLERVLFTFLPVTGSIILEWAVVSIMGASTASICAVFVCFFYFSLFCFPLGSSFRLQSPQRKDITLQSEDHLCGPLVSTGHALFCLLLPPLLHIFIFHSVLFSDLQHISEFCLVLSLPFLLMRLTRSHGSLCWINPTMTQNNPEDILSFLSCIVFVGALEYRVLILSFSHLLRLSYPIGHVLLTVTVYAAVGIIYVHTTRIASALSGRRGELEDFSTTSSRFRSQLLFYGFSLAGALGLSVVLGLRYRYWPFSLLAALSFAHFYFSRRFISYLAFVLSASICVSAFVSRMLWFLHDDVSVFAELRYFGFGLIGLMVLSLMIPGLTILNLSSAMTGLLLTLHGFGVGIGEAYMVDLGWYPTYLVFFSSMLGAALAIRLERERRLNRVTSWLMLTVYVSKLSALLPQSYPYVLVVSLFLTPAWVLHNEKKLLSLPEALFESITLMILLIYTRVQVVLPLVQLFRGTEHDPPASLVWGVLFMLWCVSTWPLWYRLLIHVTWPRSIHLALSLLAVTLVLVQPETDIEALTFSLRATFFPHSLPSVIAEHQVEASSQWAPWMLLVIVLLLLASITSLAPLAYSSVSRVVFSIVLGAALGVYVGGMYLPPLPVLFILLVAIFISVIGFILFLHWPTPETVQKLPVTYAFFMALLPVFYVSVGQELKHYPRRQGRDYLQTARVTIVSLYAALNIFIAMLVKLKVRQTKLTKGHKPVAASLMHGDSTARRSLDLDWMPGIGNLATIFAFVLTLTLNLYYFKEDDMSILLLSPILLLLSRDNRLFSELTEERRYAPLAAAVTGLMAGSILNQLFLKQAVIMIVRTVFGRSLMWTVGSYSTFEILKNLFLMVLPLPNLILFTKFLWSSVQQNDMILLALMPLNILAVVMADFRNIQALACLSIAGGLIQLLMWRQVRRQGQRFI